MENKELKESNVQAENNNVELSTNEEKYVGVDGAISKLQEELKKAELKEFAEPIIGYLVDRCKESESLAADICQIHKTWKKCYEFIVEKARKKLNSKPGLVRSDVVFEWAEDYYHKDDKAEEEKKAKEAAKKKEKAKKADISKENKARKDYDSTLKRGIDNHKLNKEEIEERTVKAKKEAQKTKTQPKKNNKDMDGQMDFFSMMGM